MDIKQLLQIFPVRDKLFSLLFPSEVIDISNAILYKLTLGDKQKYLEYTAYENGIQTTLVNNETKSTHTNRYFEKQQCKIQLEKDIKEFILTINISPAMITDPYVSSTYKVELQSSIFSLWLRMHKRSTIIFTNITQVHIDYSLSLFYSNYKTKRNMKEDKKWSFDYEINSDNTTEMTESDMYGTISTIYKHYFDIILVF